MTGAVLGLLGVFGALLFVQFGALVEMFQQVKQIRGYLDMVDTPTPLELGPSNGARPSSVGLPSVLDESAEALVLFISNKCETCVVLAQSLAGGDLPEGLWLVVVPVLSDPKEFLDQFRLRGERVLIDDGLSNRIGLDITPAAVLIERGRMTEAHTVPSVRQLYASIPGFIKRNRTLTPKAAAKLGKAQTTWKST
jgi:hypothetical protein